MMRKAILGYRIVSIVLVLPLIYSFLTGLSILTSGGTMDFPCFVEYDEQRNCVNPHGLGRIEGEGTSQIEVFLTTYMAGMSGGGCNYKVTDMNILDVPTSIIDLRFERDGSSIKVNGHGLATGTELQSQNMFNWNPWIISRLRLKNLGLVTYCQQGLQHQRIVIIGSYGTEISIVKGLSISTALVAGLVLSVLKSKRLKTSMPK